MLLNEPPSHLGNVLKNKTDYLCGKVHNHFDCVSNGNKSLLKERLICIISAIRNCFGV